MTGRDPDIPPDGTCAQCGKPRRPERSLRYGKATAVLDPFCSSDCARAWYGVTLPSARYTTGLGGSMGNKI